MNRLEDDKNQLIVRTIQDALFEAKTSINSFELPEKNGIGLFSLNFIFKMILNLYFYMRKIPNL